MEMMNRAIEDARDFRGMMDKIEARAAQLRRLERMQAERHRESVGVVQDAPAAFTNQSRQPGENREAHRARLKRERREANANKARA